MYAVPRHLIKKYPKLFAADGKQLGIDPENFGKVAQYAGLGSSVLDIGAQTINPYEDIDPTDPYSGDRMKEGASAAKSALGMAGKGAAAGATFGPIGAAVGFVGGGIYGAISGKKEAEAYNREQKAFEREAEERKIERDKAELSLYDQQEGRGSFFSANGKKLGVNTNYANMSLAAGGNIPGSQYEIPLENSEQLASDSEKVVNAGTHEQGGNVPVTDVGGNIDTYVEGNEVIVDDMVFSARNGYATIAEQLSKTKGQLEEVLHKSNDNTERNTVSREMAKIDNKIKALFEEQEAAKANLQSQNQSQHMMPDGSMMEGASHPQQPQQFANPEQY